MKSGFDVALRMVETPVDLPLLGRWLKSPHIVRWWGSQDLNTAENARWSGDTDAIITVSGQPVGYVCWQTLSPLELADAGLADLPEGLLDIDILIGEPEFIGRGVGPSALTLLLAKLRREGVTYAGVGTSTLNRAAIRAFEKAGFRSFRDFQDSEYGSCTYMIARLDGAVESVAADNYSCG